MKIVMCIIGMILVTKAIYPVGIKLIKPAWSREQNIRRQVLIVAASFAAEAAAAVMYTRLGVKVAGQMAPGSLKLAFSGFVFIMGMKFGSSTMF